MIEDVVAWSHSGPGCNRCGATAGYSVAPYWEPAKRLCPACCQEIARLFDRSDWPRLGRLDR